LNFRIPSNINFQIHNHSLVFNAYGYTEAKLADLDHRKWASNSGLKSQRRHSEVVHELDGEYQDLQFPAARIAGPIHSSVQFCIFTDFKNIKIFDLFANVLQVERLFLRVLASKIAFEQSVLDN
jgi:hypothetical protein